MLPKVSVVVPMYNVQDYLDQCVRSILAQTLSEIEIVLVDDGSPDRCGEMAEAYAAKYANVKVVHRANGGLGPARNSGIEVASGEYVAFVDSDDWVEPRMYERLYYHAKMTGAQIVYSGYKIIRNGIVAETVAHPFAGKLLQGDGEIFALRQSFYGAEPRRIKKDPVPISAWLALYENQFIRNHHLRFEAIRSEDILFNIIACQSANIIAVSGDIGYCYRKDGQSSITNSFNRDTIYEYDQFFESLFRLANCEQGVFRKTCLLRAKRRVIDYTRLLVGKIASSNLKRWEKKQLVEIACESYWIKMACKGYPFWKLPVMQAVYFAALRFHMKRSVLLLSEAKNSIAAR